jgi:HEAT repeat protein
MGVMRASILWALFASSGLSAQPRPPVQGKEPATVEEVLADLESRDFQKCRRAVEVATRLAAGNDKRIVERLLRMVSEDRRLPMRQFAAQALGHYRDERILGALEPMLKSTRGAPWGVLRGIGALRHERSRELLVPYLQDNGVRSAAIAGLAQLGDKRAFADLKRLYLGNVAQEWAHRDLAQALVALDADAGVEVKRLPSTRHSQTTMSRYIMITLRCAPLKMQFAVLMLLPGHLRLWVIILLMISTCSVPNICGPDI